LKATDLEIEQLAMTRKNDSLSGQGKIDLSHEHNYSGTLEVRLNNLLDYVSIPRGAAEKVTRSRLMFRQPSIPATGMCAV
jgi:hypothetical protein